MDYATANRLFRFDRLTGYLYWKNDASASARAGQRAGCLDRHSGYRRLRYRGEGFAEHRIVWLLVHGEMPTACIDHINRDRADNRPENLRLASVTENNRNKSLQSSNRSGVPGVYWSAEHRKWKAQIAVDGRRLFLGLHDDLAAAKRARSTAEMKYFGDFRASKAA